MHIRILVLIFLFCNPFVLAQWHNEARYPSGINCSLAYDSDRDILYMLTGDGYDSEHYTTILKPLNQLWFWSNDEWLLLDEQLPGGANSKIEYDPIRNELVLFCSGEHYQEVWRYKNRVWTKLSKKGPETRIGVQVAWDPLREAFVVYGGVPPTRTYGVRFDDTWAWDGKRWNLITDRGAYGSGPMIFSDKLKSMIMSVPYPRGSGLYVLRDNEWDYDIYAYDYDLVVYGITRYNNKIFVISREDKKYDIYWKKPTYKIYKMGISDLTETKWNNIYWLKIVGGAQNAKVSDFIIFNDTILLFSASNGRTLFKSKDREYWTGFFGGTRSLFNPSYIHDVHQDIYSDEEIIGIGARYYKKKKYDPTTLNMPRPRYDLSNAASDRRNNRTFFLGNTWGRGGMHYLLFEWDGKNWKELESEGLNLFSYSSRSLHMDTMQNKLYLVAIHNRYAGEPFEGFVFEYDDGTWHQIHKIPSELLKMKYVEETVSAIDNDSRILIVSKKMATQEIDLIENQGKPPVVFDKFNRKSNIVEDLEGNLAVAAGKAQVDGSGRDVRFWYWRDDTWQPGISIPKHVKIAENSIWRDYIRNRIVSEYSFFQIWSYGPYAGSSSGRRNLATDPDTDNSLIFDSEYNSFLAENQESIGSFENGALPFTADLDGDGIASIGLFDPARGTIHIKGQNSITLGQLGDQPVIGDYDGDGKDDIVLYRPTTGEWISTSGTIATLGTAYDTPVKGDYDGDGKTEPAVYNAESGTWTFLDGSTVHLGDTDSWPVPADYNGDGKTDIAVWNKRTSEWRTLDGVFAKFGYLQAIPAPGDYNGDGIDEPAVYQPETGEWIINGKVSHKTVKWCVPVW